MTVLVLPHPTSALSPSEVTAHARRLLPQVRQALGLPAAGAREGSSQA